MITTRKITVPAQDDQLDYINAVIEEELAPFDCPMKVLMQIQLCVEELFVNIAHYAYQPGTGDAEILVDAFGDPCQLIVTFRDHGIPFNPLLKEDADVTLSAEERGIGGLGIFLVKKKMDEVTYVYEDGANCLTIRKTW